MPAPAGPSRARAASSRPEALGRKPSASRGRVQMSEEPQPIKRVVSGQHGRAASTTATAAVPSTSKIVRPQFRTTQPVPARQLDEDHASSSSDSESTDQRVSRPTTSKSRIPVQKTSIPVQKRPTTYKSVGGKKAIKTVSSGSNSGSDDDDDDSSKPTPPTRPTPLPKSRPSLTNPSSTPYIELARRPSASGISPHHTNSSRDMPPPQNLPVKTQPSRPIEQGEFNHLIPSCFLSNRTDTSCFLHSRTQTLSSTSAYRFGFLCIREQSRSTNCCPSSPVR